MTGGKSTSEAPWPVRRLNAEVKGWIQRLGSVWVEGQLTQVNVKPTWKLSYLTLRDTESETSVQLTAPTSLIQGLASPLRDGDRVVVHGRPAFYEGRGSFSLWVTELRPVGIGELLARIERLRNQLAQEGLFDPSRKKPLPYLPRRVGLITGRGSAAERDVLSVAQDRWPAVDFRVINTPVQGATAVPEIIAALRQLDDDPSVDVIIIARGGGSVEDLLPFSEEALQRAVAAAVTPVVSAIGHEPDNPVLDNVADLRAATPTDAAKRVVPDVAEERALIAEGRSRMAAALRGWAIGKRKSCLRTFLFSYCPEAPRQGCIAPAKRKLALISRKGGALLGLSVGFWLRWWWSWDRWFCLCVLVIQSIKLLLKLADVLKKIAIVFHQIF